MPGNPVSEIGELCGMCGAEDVRTRYVTRSFDRGGRLIVIEKIPYLSCPHCGQRYFTAGTLREVERIRQA